MRRGVLVACCLAVLAALALWGWDRRAVSARHRGRGAPPVVAGRALPSVSGRASPGSFEHERLDAADVAVVRCAWPDVSDGRIEAVALDEGAPTPVASGADLTLWLEPGAYTLSAVDADGASVQLGVAELAAGEVYTCTVGAAPGPVTGVVVDLRGAPLAQVAVYGCGGRTRSADDGSFVLPTDDVACAVEAVWRDGALSRMSEQADVSAFARSVRLEVDARPIAGLGIRFAVEEDGVMVTDVRSGSPAEAAGLAEGDRIVSVDGDPVAGIDTRDFIARGTGLEGTTAMLVVERDGVTRRVDVPRARIEERVIVFDEQVIEGTPSAE